MNYIIAGLILVHSWYPAQCCHDQDCKPINCEQAQKMGNGWWRYTDLNGQSFEFSPDKVGNSQDELCHACIHNTGSPLCLFIKTVPSA